MNTLEFIHNLYGGCTGFLEVMYHNEQPKLRQGRKGVQSYWYKLPDDLDNGDFEHALQGMQFANEKLGMGVYRSVCLHQLNEDWPEGQGKGGRGTDATVRWAPCLWADFDDLDDDTIRERLRNFPLPSVVVRSGGGIHCYWKLAQPYPLREEDQKRVLRAQIEGIAKHLGTGDSSVKNPSRLMRLPGFINMKPERHGARCEVIKARDVTYSMDEFMPYRAALRETYLPPARDFNSLPDVLPRWVRHYLEFGAVVGERNNRVYAVAYEYAQQGLSMQDAYTDIIPVAQRGGLAMGEIESAIASGFRKGSGQGRQLA